MSVTATVGTRASGKVGSLLFDVASLPVNLNIGLVSIGLAHVTGDLAPSGVKLRSVKIDAKAYVCENCMTCVGVLWTEKKVVVGKSLFWAAAVSGMNGLPGHKVSDCTT